MERSDADGIEAAIPPKATTAQWLIVGLLVFSAMINYVDRQSTNVISPMLTKTFGLSGEQWGWANAIFALAYIFTSALGGIWVDRVGARKGLLISTAVWSLAAAGHSLANGFGGLCFWRVMLAVGEGPGGACLLKGIRQSLPPRLHDTGIGLVGAGTLLGALLAPILVAPLAEGLGWQAAFIITAGLGFLWIPLWVLATRSDAGRALDPKPQATGLATTPARGLDFRSTGIWATMVAIFFTVPPTVFTLSFLALYLSETFGLPVKSLAGLQWQPFLAMDLGQLTAAAVLPRLMRSGWSPYSARRLVVVAGFGCSALMLLVSVAPNLMLAMTWLNVARFFFQFAYVALLAYGISCVPAEQSGRMNGLMNACFGLCNFVFNPLIGKLADLYHHDYRIVLIMVSLSPLVGLAAWLGLSQRHARRTTERAERLEPEPAIG